MSTYVPVQAITLSAAASSVDFTGIPATFTDLVLVSSFIQNTGSAQQAQIRFNSDTATNYSLTYLDGSGSAVASGRVTNATGFALYYVASTGVSTPITSIAQIMNYANITTNKTTLVRAGSSANPVSAYVGMWRKTPEAINKITIFADQGGNFQSGTTFTLYGIGSGAPKAFGGSEVRTDGTYWYHTFRSSGQFTPTQALSNVDFLVVAGGGGGGTGYAGGCGGGGGAGGYRTSAGTSGGNSSAESKLSLTANTSYTVTVGAGGTGGTGTSRGGTGNASIFSTITSDGGGGGGVQGGTSTGGNGGSGGGAAFSSSAGGTATTNQGKDGGSTSSNGRTAGGGGASAVGTSTAATTTRADGGAGLASSITGSSVTYAGGGGGSVNDGNASGLGGSGGGGNGASYNTNNATAGTANTGGGGGGSNGISGGTTAGAAGGSGIVIVRYAV